MGESINTICCMKTSGGIKREMEGERQISGKPEVARKKNSKANAPISEENNKIRYFGWSTLSEREMQ